jgi:hypothetical protein
MRELMTEFEKHSVYGKSRKSLCVGMLLVICLAAVGFAAAQDGPMAPVQPAQPQAQKPQTQNPQDQAGSPAQPAPTDSNVSTPSGSAPAAALVPANGTPAADPANAPGTPTPNPSVAKITVPSGTHIPLVLHNAISTRSARPGDPVYFETLFPVMIDGKVVIPAGSYMSGEITESKRPGRVKGRGELMMKLTTLILPNAYMVNLNAVPSNAGTGGNETTDNEGKIVADSNKGTDIGTIAKTTGAGAGIGGLATQSAKGVGIGAGIGAAVGLAAILLTRGPEAELPRGSTVEAVIDRSILLDADKVQFTGPGQASALAGPPNREPTRSSSPF